MWYNTNTHNDACKFVIATLTPEVTQFQSHGASSLLSGQGWPFFFCHYRRVQWLKKCTWFGARCVKLDGKGAVAAAAVMTWAGAPCGSGSDVYLEMTEDMTAWGPDRVDILKWDPTGASPAGVQLQWGSDRGEELWHIIWINIMQQTAPCGAGTVTRKAANHEWDILELAVSEQSCASTDWNVKESGRQALLVKTFRWKNQKCMY